MLPAILLLYAQHMQAILNGQGRVPLEKVFLEGSAAAKILREGLMESLDGETFAKAQSLMTGFYVNREELIVAQPKPDFFLRLAREKGTPADRAFFLALSQTYPDGIWPIYIDPQSEIGGCRRFGKGELSGTYGLWLAFRRSYPKNYTGSVADELKAVENMLGADCVCSDEQSLRHELTLFIDETIPRTGTTTFL